MLVQLTVGLIIWTLASIVLGLIAPRILSFHQREARRVAASPRRNKAA